MKRLSIITINLNNAQGLKKTMDSVFAQRDKNFEFIVVDGCSQDGSVDLIRRHEEHIDWWVSETDTGIYQAMNKGIKAATGEYLLFLNSGDSFYDTEVTFKILPWLERKADVICGRLVLDEGSGPVMLTPESEITIVYFRRISLYHQATFIRKSLFDRYGLYNEGFQIGGDYEFFIRTLLRNPCSYMASDVVVCRYDTTGISNNANHLELNLQEKKRAWALNFSPAVLSELEDLYRIRESKFYWIINKTRHKGFFWFFFSGLTTSCMFFYWLMRKLRLKK